MSFESFESTLWSSNVAMENGALIEFFLARNLHLERIFQPCLMKPEGNYHHQSISTSIVQKNHHEHSPSFTHLFHLPIVSHETNDSNDHETPCGRAQRACLRHREGLQETCFPASGLSEKRPAGTGSIWIPLENHRKTIGKP